jgi:MoxR-like ATPase
MRKPTALAEESAEIAGATAPIRRLEENVARVIRGKREVIRLATVCLLARGHILIEDVPGVGKTTLAHALARSLGLSFQRIQFTSDLLPSDIIGVSFFNQKTQSFEFVPGVGKTTLAHALARSLGLSFQRIQFTSDLLPSDIIGVSFFNQKTQSFEFVPGPLFANVVLADEINRATPKTQSALLEAMSERRVSFERQRFVLPEPFAVLATQNPLEYHGTFPLPESQLDRFLMSLSLGYPPRSDERELLASGGVDALLEQLPPVLAPEELLHLQEQVKLVRVDGKLADYVLAIAEATRRGGEFLLGVSTRGAQSLYRAAQALALCEGRPFAVPDHVQQLAPAVLAHRVVLKRGTADLATTRSAIARVVEATPVPI